MRLNGKNFSSYDILGERYSLPYGGECEHPTEERILMNATILFATRGYDGTTTKMIGKAAGVTDGALYRHFSGKKVLWNAVVEHTVQLYRLYHERLAAAIADEDDFENAVNTIFEEPMLMRNGFTAFAFALIINEQVSNPLAGKTFCESFLDYSIALHKGFFDKFVERGVVNAFDTELMATTFVCTVNMGIDLAVQRILGREVRLDFAECLERLKAHILQIAVI
ncbi:MAG: TetR/AcrR family transcriptional regulator [Oscillospiraceae bacterium]|nr:TetR/AcrR family transcriptional regulator [Oscillospiraceae bacterium]